MYYIIQPLWHISKPSTVTNTKIPLSPLPTDDSKHWTQHLKALKQSEYSNHAFFLLQTGFPAGLSMEATTGSPTTTAYQTRTVSRWGGLIVLRLLLLQDSLHPSGGTIEIAGRRTTFFARKRSLKVNDCWGMYAGVRWVYVGRDLFWGR